MGEQFKKYADPDVEKKLAAEKKRREMKNRLIAEDIRRQKSSLELRPKGLMRKMGDDQARREEIRRRAQYKQEQNKHQASADQKYLQEKAQHQKTVTQQQSQEQQQKKAVQLKPGDKLNQASIKVKRDFKQAAAPQGHSQKGAPPARVSPKPVASPQPKPKPPEPPTRKR